MTILSYAAESHTAEKPNHEDQEMKANFTNDVGGRSSHEQHDHKKLKASGGDLKRDDCDGADDAG